MNDNSIKTKGDTPSSTTIYTKIKVITNKPKTPDDYHEERRKLKIFLI